MDTEFLVQMRQSNKCGSVRNDDIFNLHLGYQPFSLCRRQESQTKVPKVVPKNTSELIEPFKLCYQNATFNTRQATMSEKQVYLILDFVYSFSQHKDVTEFFYTQSSFF